MGTRDLRKCWWSQAGSNRRPLACHASALPAELWPHARRGKLRSGMRYVKQTKAIASHRRHFGVGAPFTLIGVASSPVSATGDTLKYVLSHVLLLSKQRAYPS